MGALPNIHFALRQSKGTFAVYLADDDRLKPRELATAVRRMDANDNCVAFYAPWTSFDMVTGLEGRQFYEHPEPVTIAQGNFAALMEHVAEYTVFSEICILRTEVLRQIVPLGNDLAFWAFTMPCEYAAFGDVIYGTDTFYMSVSRHFVGDTRAQLGYNDVLTAWDCYRGGLEYMYGLARDHGGLKKRKMVERAVDMIPKERMLAALKMRLKQGGDPVESYALAARLRGVGLAKNLPIPMEQIRLAAAVDFVCVKLPEVLKAERVAVAGNCPQETLEILGHVARVPVLRVDKDEAIQEKDIVFDLGVGEGAVLSAARERALHVVSEEQLLRKFA